MRTLFKGLPSQARASLAAAIILAGLCAPLAGHAQTAGLAPTLTAYHTISHRWTAVARPERLASGEPLLFVIKYENHAPSPAPVGDLYFAVPSDVALTSVADPTAAVFSVDGGRTFDQLSHLAVARDGVMAPAEMGDVTHVKWRLPHRVEPGEEGSLSVSGVRQ